METNHSAIMMMLGEIRSDVKGINNRLDMVNGRLSKHDDKIDSLESFKNEAMGKVVVLGGFSALSLGVIGQWVARQLGI